MKVVPFNAGRRGVVALYSEASRIGTQFNEAIQHPGKLVIIETARPVDWGLFLWVLLKSQKKRRPATIGES